MKKRLLLPLISISLCCVQTLAQSKNTRTISGTLVTGKNEAVAGAIITAGSSAGEQTAKSDAEGNFTLTVPREAVTLLITGKNLRTVEKTIAPGAPSGNLRIEVELIVPKIHDSLVIPTRDTNEESALGQQRMSLAQTADSLGANRASE